MSFDQTMPPSIAPPSPPSMLRVSCSAGRGKQQGPLTRAATPRSWTPSVSHGLGELNLESYFFRFRFSTTRRKLIFEFSARSLGSIESQNFWEKEES